MICYVINNIIKDDIWRKGNLYYNIQKYLFVCLLIGSTPGQDRNMRLVSIEPE
jgi:hypothetical protein